MTRHAWKMPLFRPAAIAIHDHGNMFWHQQNHSPPFGFCTTEQTVKQSERKFYAYIFFDFQLQQFTAANLRRSKRSRYRQN
jgi:hypothetical protein